MLAKNFSTKVDIEISEGMFKGLDKQQSPFVKEFILKTHSKSLKTVIGVNLFDSFEIYMVDQNGSKNLRSMMKNELLTSTRGSHISSIDVNEVANMVIVSTTNHNFIIFSSLDGQHIETKSQILYN